MLSIEQEGSKMVRTMTGLTTQSEGKTRSTTQLGDTTRWMEHIGSQANIFSRDAWNEVTRGGTQIIRGPFMPHSEKEGSQAGINTTKTFVQLGDTTRPTTRMGSTTRLEETIDRGVYVILLKVFVSGSKEIVKLGCLRSKYGHGAHEYGKSGNKLG